MTSLRELFSRRFFGSSGHASDVAAPSDCTIRPPPPDEVGIDGAGAACEPSPPAAAEATGTPTTASDASPSRKHRRLDGGCSPSASTQVAPHPPPIEMQQTKACVHSDVLWRAPRRSSSETLCYIYTHIWFRMARTHQQASSTYVVLDPEAWQHAVHSTARSAPEAFPATLVFGIGSGGSGGGGNALGGSARGRRYHGTASVEVRDDAIQTLLQVATSDDDDRWVPGLVSAPGRRANNSVCRSDDFATSMDAVFALILRLYSAHDVLDASTWLVALVLAERLYVRHQQHMATGVDHNTAFRLYRRHELRHLFTLFNLTVKLTSDYCFHLRFLHNHLPSLITRMPLARASAACTHMATRSLLPEYLRAKYPLIAQRVDQSAQAEYAGAAGGLSRLPTSPPFCLRSAANAEGSMLRFGLGYHGLVLWGDATQLMDAYCSEGERRTLEEALQAARGQH